MSTFTKPNNIDEIEKMSEELAFALAEEKLTVKEHTVYLVDLEGNFGYSALVFKDGRHIYYADDYALHHDGKTREELREWYISGLNNKLFTEEELTAPIANYSEYDRKEYFLRNYYHMRKPYVSMFRVVHNDAEEEAFKKEVEGMIQNPISFCYMAADLKPFVEHQIELLETLGKRVEEKKGDFAYWVDAFKREMFNHEYQYNWEADWSVCSAFGNPGKYWGDELWGCEERQKYFDALGFNDTQRRAYEEARKEYFKEAKEDDE